MSGYEADPRVSDFTTSLTHRARRAYNGQVVASHLLKALNRGWAPAHMAKACSKDLPTVQRDAYALVQSRIQWFADHDPPPAQPARPAGPVPWCGECADEKYRWLVDADDNPIRPCPRCHPSTQVGAAS